MPDNPHAGPFRVPGVEIEAPLPSTRDIHITSARTFRVKVDRAGDADAPTVTIAPDDVVQIELEDGTKLWTSAQRLLADIVPPQESRGAEKGREFPTGLCVGCPSRGMVGKALFKTLSFLHIVDASEEAARSIGTRWENHVLDAADDFQDTLYRCQAPAFGLSADFGAKGIPTDKPVLLFLHGTASSTIGSFGELWGADHEELRKQLFLNYEGNVYALQHRTLTQSPVQNAIAAARALPDGCRLHLVSHSRGGLVGELLCRGQAGGARDPFTAEELAYFREGDAQRSRGDLAELNEILKKKRLTVERFVRVACPARGTSLASDRLDIYLSVLFNLLSKIPFLKAPPASVVYDIFSELVMNVAKERCNPRVLPGLEAMVPDSPLINLLNRPDCEVGGELRVVAGDIEGESVSTALKAVLVHPLFVGDNDLVVDSDAMFGGMERSGGAGFSFHQGGQVSHFRYFKNEDSAARILKALTRKVQEDDGFKPFSVRETDEGAPPYRRGDGEPRPVVFLIPGFMATHLDLADDRIWLDPTDLSFGALSQLKLDQLGVRPAEPVWRYYGALAAYLAQSHEVKPFPYDWRLSAQREGGRFADEVAAALDEAEKSAQPVNIVAHSAGGMLVRAMLAYRPEVWVRLTRHPQARVVLLGTPWRGSWAVAQMLTGRESLVKKLDLLDSRHGMKEIVGILGAFPGLLEQLPAPVGDQPYRLFEPHFWEDLRLKDADGESWVAPQPQTLADARAVREKMDAAPFDSDRLLYVAGVAPATPVEVSVQDRGDGKGSVVFGATARGDGRVPWEQGLPERMKVWYLQAYHGDLANDPAGFDAIGELLKSGTTTQLPTTPPEGAAAPLRFPMPVEKAPLFPAFRDLAAAALGGSRRTGRARPTHRARVSVRHRNIGFIDCPILVGHYEGDTLVSAEAYLDRVLGGRLRDRHRLGLYPGGIDTAEIFLDPRTDCRRGAIVIGLGEVGKLTPGKLMRAVSRGVRSYATVLADRRCAGAEGPDLAAICPLLVGTSAGGISVGDSVTAILRGISHAKQMLHEGGYDDKVLVDEVRLIELYEDRAIQAAHALERARTDPDIARCFLIEPHPTVLQQNGGRRRASYFEDDSWWQRLQIVEDKAERLAFNLLTDRAREEVYLLTGEKALADRFVKEMIGAPGSTSATLAMTLFEMLVPNEIKEYAPDRRDMVLVLNEAAARYPWEMMQERPRDNAGAAADHKPLAIQAGMVRQLQVEQFRDRVVTARGHAALVVGNPHTTLFPPLFGAEKEAAEVLRQLRDFGYKPTGVIGEAATSSAVMQALYQHDYRIVHLAGHGVFEYEVGKESSCECCSQQTPKKRVTGMVIGDREFLTPAQIRQMRVVPELVFVNCCTLGKMEGSEKGPLNNPPYLAANFAAELIRMGVRAVVAAGWEVDDGAANLFAKTFYTHMLSLGTPFGKAVWMARKDVYDAYPATNTWGAYQCYGDPAFTLSAAGGSRPGGRRRQPFVAPAEAYLQLDNMAEEASTASDTRRTELKAEVQAIEKDLPGEWRQMGEVCAALGRVYGELDEFREAVKNYGYACRDSRARYSMRTVEQRLNLLARLAVEMHADPKKRAGARKLLDLVQAKLAALVTIAGKTAERYSLVGSVWKRKAVVADPGEKIEALRNMKEQYEAAAAQSCHFYPRLNGLAAAVLLHLLRKEALEEERFATKVEAARDAAAAADRENRDFWSSVAKANADVLEYLYRGSLGSQAFEVVEAFREARKSSGSPRELRSVLEDIAFMEEMLSKAPAGEGADRAKLAELVGALGAIRTALTQ